MVDGDAEVTPEPVITGPVMTREEARAWRERWQLVNDFEREELQRTPMSVKARQLAALMNTALAFGWHTSTDAEIQEVRDRWISLKRLLCER